MLIFNIRLHCVTKKRHLVPSILKHIFNFATEIRHSVFYWRGQIKNGSITDSILYSNPVQRIRTLISNI